MSSGEDLAGPPLRERWFEDYVVGEVREFGRTVVDEAEVIEFARRYDPQGFHLDPEAARRSPYGGLIASGWHTAAMTMRMLVDHYVSRVAALGSPGVDALRWLLPVRPGDVLAVRSRVLETRRSRSDPARGILRSGIEVLNQRGEMVMSLEAVTLLKCRNPGA
jgi:acyl dehydratase